MIARPATPQATALRTVLCPSNTGGERDAKSAAPAQAEPGSGSTQLWGSH